jgi:hypothetical protein
MATTDARAGFRLPWSYDRQSGENPDGESTDQTTAAATGWPSEDGAPQGAGSSDAVGTLDAPSGQTDPEPAPVAPAPAPKPSGKKPSKFMADLTKAMQAAAEDARTRALTQLQGDAKTQVEAIHGRSSTEAAGLRRKADDDVAAVREWSKAEIARIREETETKITDRKAQLESQIEEHAAVIEREIDAVQKTVAAFEDDMAAFFERLLAEEDPSRFATMAENLPEPPSFDGIVAGDASDEAEASMEAVAAVETIEPEAAVETVEAEATADEVVGEAETVADDTADGDATASTGHAAEGGDSEIDRESAFAAIQAAAEAAGSAEVAADAAARAEAVADVAIEIIGNHDDAEDDADPRYAALGLSPDYDAAEAEAFADAGASDEDIPEIGDDALAARLAGLVPGKGKGKGDDSAAATQVVVVGLVSVASIASFKRHLGRVAGVQSVGVSSGPDGEFVFAVSHGADVVLRDAIPSLPSFQARVTGSTDGIVHVTAHDPESDA